MGRDNSNAGQRVLQARKYLRGADDSLANIIGGGIIDGAVCFVIEKQANYRFLQSSTLAADEHGIVIEPVGGVGRWVRETGTMGFALLNGGVPDAPNASVSNIVRYASAQLVQFALENDTGIVIYTGAVTRFALLVPYANTGFAPGVSVNHGDGAWHAACGVTELKTGSRLSMVAGVPVADMSASLQVILL